MNKTISLIIFDDQPNGMQELMALIRRQPGITLLATASAIEEGIHIVCKLKPDIVLLNLTRHGDDALTVAGSLHGLAPRSRVIVMGMEPKEADLISWVRAGVVGFVMNTDSLEECLNTINSVSFGDDVLPAVLVAGLFHHLGPLGKQGHVARTLRLENLTGPQHLVAELMIRGMNAGQMAAALDMSRPVVRRHRSKILATLQSNDHLEVNGLKHIQTPRALAPDPMSIPLTALSRSLDLDHIRLL